MNSLEKHVWESIGGPSQPAPVAVSAHLVERRRVLVTGAGGSIGSALAHAAASMGTEQIILLEASEQALYRIDRDLAAPHHTVLASAGDAPALEEVFAQHRPQIIFHAAAFKHVPLMEAHPFAALANNAVATFTLAQTAIRYGAEQVVLVSTDKAAAPSSIMGASKRVAEMAALALASRATIIKVVRLGNVYASQGSVVPLFEEQIARGGPVTVTHPEATRYFVSVEQTVALLLLALSEKYPGNVLVPDLPQPVLIRRIAEALINASDSNSQITYTGLRPGEKLHEQLIGPDESYADANPAPLRSVLSPVISAKEAASAIAELQHAVEQRDLNRLLSTVQRLVPGYQPSETVLARQAFAEPHA